MEAELEWVRSSPKARQAKNKARLARYEEMEAEARASQKLDWTDIRIPVGPRLGNKVLELIICTRNSMAACSSMTFRSPCRATASWA